MKTLKEHTILYDSVCPMCRLYTGAFVRSKLLDDKGRTAYQDLPEGSCPGLDRARAVNEIALVNRRTGEVTYGVASLFKILGHRWPVFRPLFASKAFAWTMRQAYSLVSYNRRVIMPAAGEGAGAAPAFHRGWRAAWVAVSSIGASALLTASGLCPGFLSSLTVILYALAIMASIGILKPAKLWDALGTGSTVLFAGSVLLRMLSVFPLPATTCMLIAGTLVTVEMARRAKIILGVA